MYAIGARIKTVRKSLGMTQKDFAEPLEITQSSLSGIETGKEPPCRPLLLLLCKEYQVRREWLLDGEDTDMFEQSRADEPGACLISAIEGEIVTSEDSGAGGSVFNRMDCTEERNPYIADLYSILANETAVGRISRAQMELQDKQRAVYRQIFERLTEEGKRLIVQYDNAEGEIHEVIAKESFISGFRTAFHLLGEAKARK